MPSLITREPGSFRDPSSVVFRKDGVVYRQVNVAAARNYSALMESGLYSSLVSQGHLVPHEETESEPLDQQTCYKVIKPRQLPFISYPYEWCFSQYKEAALLTLAVQRNAMGYGMSLSDASAYNVQHLNGRAVFIDTLSFEIIKTGQPWAPYRQFCQHFLAPLALMARVDIRLSHLMQSYLDGVPLDLASRLLPLWTWLDPGLLLGIHLHARWVKRGERAKPHRLASGPPQFSEAALLQLVDTLRGGVARLRWRPAGSVWADYYQETSYTEAAMEQKQRLVESYLRRVAPRTVWDLGANTGRFSLLAAAVAEHVVAIDRDESSIEALYQRCRQEGRANILPLVVDLTAPSPGLGWENGERASLVDRGPADMVMALALVHHLAIGSNIPLGHIADFLSRVGRWLIVEFIPKEDPQVGRMLAHRCDIFDSYSEGQFESEFASRFEILDGCQLGDSVRKLYLMRRRES